MTRAAFIDESQRPGFYAVAAAVIDLSAVNVVRRRLKAFSPRDGTTRRHFVKESDTSRKLMLGILDRLPNTAHLVVTLNDGGRSHPVEMRARCLRRLVTDLVSGGLDRVILDNVEPDQRHRDRQVLAPILNGTGVTYGHEPEHSREPLLWLPDAIAWCSGRSDHWRADIEGCSTIISL